MADDTHPDQALAVAKLEPRPAGAAAAGSAVRATRRDDPFLPPGYLTPTNDLRRRAPARAAPRTAWPSASTCARRRSGRAGARRRQHFVTSANVCSARSRRRSPSCWGPTAKSCWRSCGEAGAASRGIFGEAVGGLVEQGVHLCRRGETRRRSSMTAIGKLGGVAELGVSWAGTKALMWAIEKRLEPGPGPVPLDRRERQRERSRTGRTCRACDRRSDADGEADAGVRARHGFQHAGQLRRPARRRAATCGPRSSANSPGGIYAFEHRTLSESPIDNALQLAEALPRDAHVSLVSHSRGGLVADLLCLGDFDALIDRYKYGFEGIGEADPSRNEAGARRDCAARTPSTATTCASWPRCCATSARRSSAMCAPPVRHRAPCWPSGNFDLFLSGPAHADRPGAVLLRQPVVFGLQARGSSRSRKTAPTRTWCRASRRCCPTRRWRGCCATRRCAPASRWR